MLKPIGSQMGYLVQEGGLFPHLSARQNVALAAESQAWPRDRIDARLAELVNLVGLDDADISKYPSELSGGQRQRVGLLRALMLDPLPMSNLTRSQFIAQMGYLVQEGGLFPHLSARQNIALADRY